MAPTFGLQFLKMIRDSSSKCKSSTVDMYVSPVAPLPKWVHPFKIHQHIQKKCKYRCKWSKLSNSDPTTLHHYIPDSHLFEVPSFDSWQHPHRLYISNEIYQANALSLTLISQKSSNNKNPKSPKSWALNVTQLTTHNIQKPSEAAIRKAVDTNHRLSGEDGAGALLKQWHV